MSKVSAFSELPRFYESDSTNWVSWIFNETLSSVFDNRTKFFKEQHELLRLPYGNGAFEMVFLLPCSPYVDLNDLKSVDPETWKSLMSSALNMTLKVKIQKFKIGTSMNLDGPLSDMGMGTAFSDKADFSKIAGVPGEIRMKDTRQACYIEVNEAGTKAGAATAVPVIMVGAGPGGPAGTREFVADRPFLFAVVETSTQGIVLMGQFCGRQ